MPSIKLVLPEPPSSNRYWRHAKGRTYLSAEAKAYRLTVASRFCVAKAKVLKDGPVAIILVWNRSRKSGDLDNRIKQVLDALQGLAYNDDSQITEIHAYRRDKPRDGNLVVDIFNTEATP